MDSVRPKYPALYVYYDGSLGVLITQECWTQDVDRWFWSNAGEYLVDSEAVRFDQRCARSTDGRPVDVPEWIRVSTLSADDVYSLAESSPDPKVMLNQLDQLNSATARIAYLIGS